jgi:hypothetical protein
MGEKLVPKGFKTVREMRELFSSIGFEKAPGLDCCQFKFANPVIGVFFLQLTINQMVWLNHAVKLIEAQVEEVPI